ncbi:unnamed protein product [Darwinula stevensoni]|uniref:Peptidase S1 domain-containing protein n=1 Tax=Darwinula stevensoni TaxID=69355 RepID=A0A7R9FPU1_9CRUS|nr:unnamed protein product [Darwinula stevensoni]CAG0898076.1 unnamed protein product [Darwinula stevensoni]
MLKAILGEGEESGDIRWTTGGTLISFRWILTAASSVETSRPLVVRLGEHDLSDPYETITEIFNVTQTIPHPNWRSGLSRTNYHNIALLRLDREVSFRPISFPACLPTKEDTLSLGRKSTPIVAGWGTTSFGGKESNILQKAKAPLIDPSKCEEVVSRYNFLKRIYPNGMMGQVLCAGGAGQDLCQGDTGGPLMLPRDGEKCQYNVIGIVSTGVGCGGDFPGFYTQVSSYLDWIEGIVWKSDP